MKTLPAFLCAFAVLAPIVAWSAQLPISQWPAPPTGSTSLQQGDLLVGTRNGQTYGLTFPSIGSLSPAGSQYAIQYNAGSGNLGGLLPGVGQIVSGSVGAPIATATPTLGSSGTTGTLTLSGSTSGSATLQPSSSGSAWSLTLPTTAGTNGYVLSTNGSGVTSWIAQTGGGSSGLFTSLVGINLNGTSLSTPQSGTVIQAANANATATRIEADAYGAATYFSGVRVDGTAASPTAIQSGDEIAGFNALGYNGTARVGPMAAFRTYASQNWGSGANGTYADIAATPNGSSTEAEVIRFNGDGGVTVPATVTGGDQGPGTINATGLYVNGVSVSAGGSGTGSSSTGQLLANSSGSVVGSGFGANPVSAAGLYSYPIVSSSGHAAFGDSITCGAGAGNQGSCSTNGYANLLSSDEGTTLTNYGVSGDQACDQANNHIMPSGNPGETKNPVYTYMIGTNDANKNGVGAYETVYQDCHRAGLSWMAIPSNYKTYAQNCTLTGTWTANTTYGTGVASSTTSQGATASCAITTYGGPVYAWYQHIDGDAGVFTYSVDGGSAVSLNTATTPAIGPTYNGGTLGVGFIRVTGLSAGSHTILFTKSSSAGTLALAGVGTPSPYPYWGSPKVFSAGVPKQQNDNISATTAQYNADALADVNLLAGDGLPIFFVNIRNYLNSTTDMWNTEHPNSTGHGHLRDAFASVEQYTPASAGLFSISGNDGLYSGGTGAIVQAPTVSGMPSYERSNNSEAISATNLIPGFCVYCFGKGVSGGYDFGMDLGYNSGQYRTRLFTPNLADIAFSTYPAATTPTGQSSFTDLMVIKGNTGNVGIGTISPGFPLTVNGVIAQYAAVGSSLSTYMQTNSTNQSSATLLSAGLLVANATGYPFGLDLGSSGSRYRTRVFAPDSGDISFSFNAHGTAPTAQSSFTDAVTIYGSNGWVGIGSTAPAAALDNDLGNFLVHGGSTPTTSSCGTSPTITGSTSSFKILMGSGTLTSCTITFATVYAVAPQACELTAANSTAAATGTTGAYVAAITASNMNIAGANLTNAAYYVHCF